MIKLAVISVITALMANSHAAAAEFAVARTDTPVLNTADFRSVFGGKDGRTLRQDACGQLRSLEFVALQGTAFTIEGELQNDGHRIYRVRTSDYPYETRSGYFVDERFITLTKEKPPERAPVLPSREAIIAALEKMEGSRYVWGGNRFQGVPAVPEYYPPAGKTPLARQEKTLWQLKGVDCSGLLYEATAGYTPRNTSALVNYGTGLKIRGKSAGEIAALLQPLDLVVWPGHVLVVIDGGRLIESRLVCSEPDRGVRIRPLGEALGDIMKKRTPVDRISNSGSEFVVRRWYNGR